MNFIFVTMHLSLLSYSDQEFCSYIVTSLWMTLPELTANSLNNVVLENVTYSGNCKTNDSIQAKLPDNGDSCTSEIYRPRKRVAETVTDNTVKHEGYCCPYNDWSSWNPAKSLEEK